MILGKHSVSKGGGIWYPQARKSLYPIPHPYISRKFLEPINERRGDVNHKIALQVLKALTYLSG